MDIKFCPQCRCTTWHVDGVCEWVDAHKRLIRFEGLDSATVYVNQDLVSFVRVSLDRPGCTEIIMLEGAVHVKGSVDDVAVAVFGDR